MKIASFETEQFFARYEFNTPYQLCNSDCESISIAELLSLAGDSLDQFGRERLVYTESQGSFKLRESIASMHGNVNADDVIVLGTPVEGIYLVARALLDPGDEVIVLTPAYDALTKMVVVNFPHNPTGYLPTAEFQQELASLAVDHDLWLFCDEMYFGLVHSGTPPIRSAAEVSMNSIVLSGLSKTFGLPGLRCGWLIVQDETLRDNIMNWKYYTSICPPVPTEYLAIAALKVWETLRDRNIARIEQNLELADAFFARWPGLFTWRRPLAGSTALVGYHVPSVRAVSEKLAKEEGILIQSAGMLGSDDQHMRIGFGRDSFAEVLGKFEDWLNRDSVVR